jgi:hypothetical protein
LLEPGTVLVGIGIVVQKNRAYLNEEKSEDEERSGKLHPFNNPVVSKRSTSESGLNAP